MVVAIIAITAGLAVAGATMPTTAECVAREAKRFAGALEHASARAQWRAETLGVSADGDGWRFWRRPADANRWLPVRRATTCSTRTGCPPESSSRRCRSPGSSLPADAIVPLRASGRNEPFAFVLTGKDARIVLSADPLNRVTMQRGYGVRASHDPKPAASR